MHTASEVFKMLADQFEANRPFVVYRKPDHTEVKAMLQDDDEVYFGDGVAASGFIFAPFNAAENSYFIPEANSESFRFNFEIPEKTISEEIPANEVFNFALQEKDQQAHEKLVQSGIDAIENKEFKKVVLARSESVRLPDPDPFRIFKKLLEKYDSAFVHLWYHPKTGIWMGASPETLINTERTHFKTMALAGTQLFNGEEEVSWRPKEAEEQEFVTSYILQSLQNLEEVKEVNATSPFTSRAGNLLHIRTDITGQMRSKDDLAEIVKALHPTPAICGLPRDKALQFILKNEKHQREFYSGYLGEVNLKTETKRNSNRRNQEQQQFAAISKRSDLYVNLRCMKLQQDKATIFVGGGITKDSNAGEEWMETVNKSQTMKSVLVK